MFDTVKHFNAELRDLLGGESPIDAVSCQAALGADRLERTPEEVAHLFRFLPRGVRDEAVELLRAGPGAPRQDPKAWEKVVDRVLDAVGGDLVGGDPDKLLGGVSAAGHVGSWAHRLSAVLEKASMTYCVVSSSRLVFAEHKVDGPFVALATLPRAAVLRARRAGRVFPRGRVLLDFADLSQLALMTGMLSTGAADRLVAALNHGIVRDG